MPGPSTARLYRRVMEDGDDPQACSAGMAAGDADLSHPARRARVAGQPLRRARRAARQHLRHPRRGPLRRRRLGRPRPAPAGAPPRQPRAGGARRRVRHAVAGPQPRPRARAPPRPARRRPPRRPAAPADPPDRDGAASSEWRRSAVAATSNGSGRAPTPTTERRRPDPGGRPAKLSARGDRRRHRDLPRRICARRRRDGLGGPDVRAAPGRDLAPDPHRVREPPGPVRHDHPADEDVPRPRRGDGAVRADRVARAGRRVARPHDRRGTG